MSEPGAVKITLASLELADGGGVLVRPELSAPPRLRERSKRILQLAANVGSSLLT